MTTFSALRALTLAAAVMALPALAQARDLSENANNGTTSAPFAYSMQVTRAHDTAGIPAAVGNNAQASEAKLGALATTQDHARSPLLINSVGA
ncbi:glycosyl transferase family 39 [Roseomonas sp. GC11]|uniref:glycosyl transferase family 39 n=1 Tax=Roseomonas sp. GC11 TaxID=2950546 RepID=UPI00210C563F|nr:glycosyl transferase family 39 [Roseomonas sp. GC11]MCQ4159981.1 glycosyl transferase family 39 [Roseomonas sp. GC11]